MALCNLGKWLVLMVRQFVICEYECRKGAAATRYFEGRAALGAWRAVREEAEQEPRAP
jgi:hypothetical protein